MGGGAKAVWNFSENSSVLEWGSFPNPSIQSQSTYSTTVSDGIISEFTRLLRLDDRLLEMRISLSHSEESGSGRIVVGPQPTESFHGLADMLGRVFSWRIGGQGSRLLRNTNHHTCNQCD